MGQGRGTLHGHNRHALDRGYASVPFEMTVMGEDEYVCFFMAMHVHNDIDLVSAPAA